MLKERHLQARRGGEGASGRDYMAFGTFLDKKGIGWIRYIFLQCSKNVLSISGADLWQSDRRDRGVFGRGPGDEGSGPRKTINPAK